MDLNSAVIGIELGSTRIKAVLIDENHQVLASGAYSWQNSLENGVWVYPLEAAVAGIRACYRELNADVEAKFGQKLRRVAAIGISGMMHGYLVLDKDGKQLAPFCTWRNTITGPAAEALTELFKFNIPQRWSIAHLYQAILNEESHIPDIARLTTLSGYIHHLLTDQWAMGVGEASGMFPYDEETNTFDPIRVAQFNALVKAKDLPWTLEQILPQVLPAGTQAGVLTQTGASLLDETGTLEAGIPMCPPEGDAGTGMVATNAILPRTGSVSAGTSSFAMLVLEKPLKGYYPEIDVVCTPSGKTVAMAHTNTCTSEIDAWVNLIANAAKVMGWPVDMNTLYSTLFHKALEGKPDCDGIISFNYFAGEPLTGTETGRPMVLRLPESKMDIPNFMRSQLYGAIATLKLGVDMLVEKEQVETDRLMGHGGYFKTPGVGQQILADALNVPITTMETAGEGGPWGMALLAAYMQRKRDGQSLEDYLQSQVFRNAKGSRLDPDPEGVAGFARYIDRYKAALAAQHAAGGMV
ncbi:MAG: ATPase [Oscillospiraceae bacterium]|nr:ATPase [Oscillospiraceae bacterium]